MIGIVVHSAKGSEWEEHKYVKKVDGNYYYPNGYGKGREIKDLKGGNGEKKVETNADLSSDDVEAFARDVIRGVFGNGQVRKDLLGENYQKIQDRVNEIMRSSPLASTKLSDMANSDVAKEGEKAAKKVAANTAGMDMNTVYAVYGDKFEDNRKGAPKNSKRARAR